MSEEELLAEVYRDRVLTLVPLGDKGTLVPEAEAALKEKYLRWCQPRGGGYCLGLFTDGPYLRTDDRRTLALALAFGGVLDETRGAVAPPARQELRDLVGHGVQLRASRATDGEHLLPDDLLPRHA
jgi:hypothetical protein